MSEVKSTLSTSSPTHRKKKRNSNIPYVTQCINGYIMGLQENSAKMPKIFVDGERFQPDAPYHKNQTQIYFIMSTDGPRGIKYKLNYLEDESLLTLQQLLPTYAHLSELRFEHCSLTYDQILFIHMILQENPQIVQLSLNGNPKINPADESALHMPVVGTHLKLFSLQLCDVREDIATLIYNELGLTNYARTLVILNLGCNQLGDEGCAIIGNILRANRTLQALNISQNCITEQALINFVGVFMRFALTNDEVRYKRQLCFNMLMSIYFPNDKKKSSLLSSLQTSLETKSTDESNHPFVNDAYREDDQIYCHGNNSLIHLNVAYNDITNDVLEALLNAVKYQKKTFKTGGLQRLVVDSDKQFPDLKQEINKFLNNSGPSRLGKVRPVSVV